MQVPHIFKPDVQFVELSIEQFVRRVKKVNDDQTIQSPAYKTKLTDAENDLIAKYFSTTRENTCRPSLIAFPHFQAFPSRVHKVVHSFRTGMLIDAMQCLQGLSSSGCIKAFPVEVCPFVILLSYLLDCCYFDHHSVIQGRASPEPCSITEAVEQCNDKMKGNIILDNSMVVPIFQFILLLS